MGRYAFFFAALILLGLSAIAASSKKLDVDLPELNDIPKAEGLKPSSVEKNGPEIKGTSGSSIQYSVLKIQHARSFLHRQGGTVAVGPLSSVSLSGAPPTTERFSTLVRVACPQGMGAPIEVNILDERGDAAMSSSGHVTFRRGAKETDYLIEWSPTPLRFSGTYAVAVRVAGQPMGSWPLKVSEPK